MSETQAEPETRAKGRSEQGRWFYARRLKIALGIAVVEGIFVAVANDISRWTVIAISIPIILFYVFAGRNLDSDTGRQISWIAAASQAFTVILCVVAALLGPLTLILAGVFAVIALILIVGEKPDKSAKKT
ncbi:MAG: hypothetical protein ACM3QU_00360 [Verrucomicrobiota bacterium]